MIHDAFRRSVQFAIVARICGRATAVTINSRPARKTPTPRTVRSKYEVRRDMWLSVRARGGRCLDRCGMAARLGLLFAARPRLLWAPDPGGTHARQSPHQPNPAGASARPGPARGRLRIEFPVS